MNPDAHKPLTDRELDDWERWCRREITWQGRDVARLIAMIRQLKRELEQSGGVKPPDPP